MTIIYIIAILLQAGIIIYFLRKSKQKAEKRAAARPAETSSYEGARNTAIEVTAQDLQLNIPENQKLVYGVVMDWDMGTTVLTLAAYLTGAASVYLSSGPAITGGGKNPEVGELASKLVTNAQDYINRAIPVITADKPTEGCIRFYLLTNHGIYAAQEELKYLEDTTSPWLALFIRGNTVINEMRAGLN